MARTNAAGDPGPTDTREGFLSSPRTKLGWWSVGLAAAFVVLFTIDVKVLEPLTLGVPTVISFYGTTMLCGLAAGFIGLIAVLRQHERSWLVCLAMLLGAMLVTGLLFFPVLFLLYLFLDLSTTGWGFM